MTERIGRDALNELNRATTALALELPGPVYDDYRSRLDAFIASVQPVGSITLTPEEAVTARFAIKYTRHRAVLGGRDQAHMKALEAKLEAAS